jgi:hypothetical protein
MRRERTTITSGHDVMGQENQVPRRKQKGLSQRENATKETHLKNENTKNSSPME